jgi:hypothetical protein
MGHTIYASFADTALAEKAAGALLDHGVKKEDLTVICNQTEIDNEPTYQAQDVDVTPGAPPVYAADGTLGTSANYVEAGTYAESEPATMVESDVDENDAADRWDKSDSSAKEGISTTTGADAGVGAAKGAGIGLGVGALAALASVFVPGVGLVLGGGALAMAIGGAAGSTVAGGAAGAVTGYLKDQGVDQQIAQHYEDGVENGGAFIALTIPSGDVDEAKAGDIMSKYGATNVNAYASTRSGYLA